MTDHVLGIDLGGSNLRVALSDGVGATVADTTVATATTDAEAVVAQLADVSRAVVDGAGLAWARLAGLAVGVPGVVDGDGGALHLAPNLPSFSGVDVAAALAQRLALPVTLDNDVNMATLAEQRHGFGAGVADFVFMAIGTGVGMGVVADDQLVRGAAGAAGEIAFLPLGLDPFDPALHRHGALEEAAGGVGVARRYAALAGTDTDNNALDVYARAAGGDAQAQAVLDAQARALALAVVSVQAVLDPAIVVFGGGIGSRPDVVTRVREYVSRLVVDRVPRIEISRLGERAGLIGALERARRDHVKAINNDGATADAS